MTISQAGGDGEVLGHLVGHDDTAKRGGWTIEHLIRHDDRGGAGVIGHLIRHDDIAGRGRSGGERLDIL